MSCRYSRELEKSESYSGLGVVLAVLGNVMWVGILVGLVAASFGGK